MIGGIMKLYHLSYDFIGKEVLMKAKITDRRMSKEDHITPRISVSKTIEGCIFGKEGVPKGKIAKKYMRLYRPYSLYICDVSVSKVYTPTITQVPDCIRHGEAHREYWLLEDTWFGFVGLVDYESFPYTC